MKTDTSGMIAHVDEVMRQIDRAAYKRGYDDARNNMPSDTNEAYLKGVEVGQRNSVVCKDTTDMFEGYYRVGDEVVGSMNNLYIVTYVNGDILLALGKDGIQRFIHREDVQRTGLHYPHIVDILEVLREHDYERFGRK